jgi:hypothetical protein
MKKILLSASLILAGFCLPKTARATAWEHVNGGPPLTIDGPTHFTVYCQFLSMQVCYWFQDKYIWVDTYHHGTAEGSSAPPDPTVEVTFETTCPFDPPQQ